MEIGLELKERILKFRLVCQGFNMPLPFALFERIFQLVLHVAILIIRCDICVDQSNIHI